MIRAPAFDTLRAVLAGHLARQPERTFLIAPETGRILSYREIDRQARLLARYLRSRGLKRGDKVALYLHNGYQAALLFLSAMIGGYVVAPLNLLAQRSQLTYVLGHCDCRMLFTSREHEKSLGEALAGVKRGIEVIVIDPDAAGLFIEKELPQTDFESLAPEDPALLMYTSGTTGKPKGVMHTVGNFDATKVAMEELCIMMHPKLFSYLPLSHIAERVGIEICGIYRGAEFSFAESLETFPKNLAETQPNLFFAVPRIWAKFREKILEKIPQKKLSRLLSIPIVNSIVKKSIRKKLGLAETEHIFSGAAPISVDLLKWFESIGITILQGIGMTEDCIYSHVNRIGNNKIGTVGIPFSGLKIKISSEGELRLKGPSNMKGYYKEPELTAEAFDEEGYLCTGDKGEIDPKQFLTIVGRLKDQFKTDKGKYVAPAPIEMKLLANEDIEQVCIVGMGIPQPIALTVLSAAGKAKSKEALIQSLSSSLVQVNAGLESYEKLEKSVIMRGDWTIENGLMTPTMKVKRNEVEKIHVPKYPDWYHAKEGVVIWE